MAIEFTKEEVSQIMDITVSYTDLMRQSIDLQKAIEKAEWELKNLAGKMEHLKEREMHFFFDLGSKYDMDPKTIQLEAANMVVNSTTDEVHK